MDNLLFIGYAFLTAFVPFIVTFLIFNNMNKRKGILTSRIHCGITIAFAIYIISVFYFTGTGTLYDILHYRFEITKKLNFMPFSNEIDIVAYLQNILLFIPFGILLPFLWKKYDKVLYILVSGFSFSMFIEVTQLLNNRSTDIDDLILNTIGGLIGYGIYKMFVCVIKSEPESCDCCKWEPFIYIVVMFMGRFLLFNEFGFAKLLYGF
ncbi:teicoplanin resistance protein VanZ [Clostridium botulinum B2 128]|uniref:VanZ family protein n=1 Tax=Clostridium botulinum TaxID=1491 RepID=UPI0007DEABBE|nr:VanZ family protein [Clostridium botulinum]KEI74937.1 teicoplanin resistance protein VanZ [Clostridium botulinum B2 128]NFI41454.1 VanZ family protein [Clostridium botulinum]NFI76110.1 VanZ family protein [Clostridium botulinum]NFJ35625.1 VanZ family protein [Clostridium botulinum]